MFGEVWENVFGIQTLSKKTLKHDLKLTLEYFGSSEVCAKVWSGCKILRKGECIMVVFSKVIINPKKRSFRFSTWSFSIYQNHFFPQSFVSTSSTCQFFCLTAEDMGYFDWVDQFLAENPGYVELSDRMILVPLISQTLSQWSFLVPSIGGRYHIIPQLAVYTTYILPIGWLYITYHPLREPETAIDWGSEVKEVGDSLRGWCSFFRNFPPTFQVEFFGPKKLFESHFLFGNNWLLSLGKVGATGR